jgi:sulfate transport system ATP-binding protein
MSISVSNVTKRFGKSVALDRVSMDVPQGELLALLGPSGCGKTTLLRVIAGLEQPDEGTVRHSDADVTRRAVKDRNFGFVFQHYALFKHMTVFENVAFGLRVRGWADDKVRDRVGELLRLVRLDEMGPRYPSQLSGGQRQRIALVRALAPEPKVILLDEPFGALDAKVRTELRDWLRRFHDEFHVTSLFVTHDQEEAFAVADKVVVMNRGRVEQTGTPGEVFEHPATAFVMDFLGNVNAVPVPADGRPGLPFDWSRSRGKVLVDEKGESKAYLRPHELDLDRTPRPNSIQARVMHVNPAGSVVKVRVWSEDFGLVFNVDVPPDRYRVLTVKNGDGVYLFPKDHLQGPDYSI